MTIRWNMINRFLLIVLLTTCMILTTACNRDTSVEESTSEENILNIGILIYRFDDQFIQYIMNEIGIEKDILQKTEKKKIVIDFIDGRNQADLQYDQFEELLGKKYDALAINLVDRSEAAKVIDLAKSADIPVVFFNREPVQVDMARWDKIYYVGSKGETAGQIQGEIVVDYWESHPEADKNGDGIIQYILIEGQPGHQDAILRTETSIAAIKNSDLEMQELVRDNANWQRQESKEKMLTYLDLFKNEVEVIISNNDMMALGAIDAMKELGLKEDELIPIVGVDAIDSALEALKNKEMIGTVFNDSKKQGEMVMRIAYYLAKQIDPKKMITEIENGKYYRVEYKKITE